jgi:hypothetical protein
VIEYSDIVSVRCLSGIFLLFACRKREEFTVSVLF